MNQDDLIRMARVADPFGERGRLFDMAQLTPETLVRFAALVAAAAKAEEREACGKLLDEMSAQDKWSNYYKVAARAIRARGNT